MQEDAQPCETKVEFLKRNGFCFGSLKVGHMSKNCVKITTCQTCNFEHPTILHIKRSHPTTDVTSPHNKPQRPKPEETSISSALVSLGEGQGTGPGKDCILAIVPVQVKLQWK